MQTYNIIQIPLDLRNKVNLRMATTARYIEERDTKRDKFKLQ
jgi:hypothetical protein